MQDSTKKVYALKEFHRKGATSSPCSVSFRSLGMAFPDTKHATASVLLKLYGLLEMLEERTLNASKSKNAMGIFKYSCPG